MSLGIVVHGEHGTGKSWLGATSPAYRLALDAEGGSRFTVETKCYWNPATGEAPPEPGVGRTTPQGDVGPLDWRTCIVQVRDFYTMEKAMEWIESGRHPFRSVVVDSITEMQKRVIDRVSGVHQPTQQDWGEILRVTEDLTRKLRDLMFHPVRPLECVVLIAGTHLRDGQYRPFVKGQLELTLPSYVDVVGYLYVEVNPESQQLERKLLIAPIGGFDAKDRTNSLTMQYGAIVTQPNLETFLQVISTN